MTEVWYCTRESVARALDYKLTARDFDRIDEAIPAASREIEGELNLTFYPLTATYRFDWPNKQTARSWRLWLDDLQLIQLTALTTGPVTIPVNNVKLYPTQGPPYSRIELDISTSSAFGSGLTYQYDIAATGIWGGCPLVETQDATLAEALDATETDVDISKSSQIGVGSIIRVDDERMLVVNRQMIDTTQNITSNLTADSAVTTVGVGSGAAFAVNEVILVGSERMLVTDIAANNLVVRRSWDGTALAAHTTGDDVFALRTLQVLRGALGTVAATHASSAAVQVFSPPSLIRTLAKACTIDVLLNESAGYARVSGSGDNEREMSGKALAQLWTKAKAAYGRQGRSRAV